MQVRGIRGATTAEENTPEAILDGARDLLQELITANPTLKREDIAAALFSVTEDLDAAFPAQAARELGWTQVPMLCFREIPVPGSLARCIRILIHWNTESQQADVRHVYLKEASSLRPDIEERAS
jgi:chorismate mutase